MTSEDVKDLVQALDRQTKCFESIAMSLEKIVNPPKSLTEIAKEYAATKPLFPTKEAK